MGYTPMWVFLNTADFPQIKASEVVQLICGFLIFRQSKHFRYACCIIVYIHMEYRLQNTPVETSSCEVLDHLPTDRRVHPGGESVKIIVRKTR